METKNIWHTGTEIPNGKDRYIFKWKDRNSYKLVRGKEWVENRLQSPTAFRYHIERWAYIKDLESICEQLQQEPIDWEQRRYEIAKEMLPIIYYDDKPAEGEDYLTLPQIANEAVRFADTLIKKLKKSHE